MAASLAAWQASSNTSKQAPLILMLASQVWGLGFEQYWICVCYVVPTIGGISSLWKKTLLGFRHDRAIIQGYSDSGSGLGFQAYSQADCKTIGRHSS